MNTEIPRFSSGFERLYCDKTVFDAFSAFHPISFGRVLPFQSQDPVMDDPRLIAAEEAHLADNNDDTRRGVIDADVSCGLLPEAEADNVKSVIDDYSGADFFELMGMVYANAGMFICALRWYREFILELETKSPNSCSDTENIFASVGYCLYSLGLFEEAIAWSKSCVGSRLTADAVCQALMGYEAQLASGRILAIERGGPAVRYTSSALDPVQASQITPRLQTAMNAFVPFQKIYIDWVSLETPAPDIKPGDYPFKVERDASDLPRHKMNLIFATCAQADALMEKGCKFEAKRLLSEVALLEPEADIVLERLKALT